MTLSAVPADEAQPPSIDNTRIENTANRAFCNIVTIHRLNRFPTPPSCSGTDESGSALLSNFNRWRSDYRVPRSLEDCVRDGRSHLRGESIINARQMQRRGGSCFPRCAERSPAHLAFVVCYRRAPAIGLVLALGVGRVCRALGVRQLVDAVPRCCASAALRSTGASRSSASKKPRPSISKSTVRTATVSYGSATQYGSELDARLAFDALGKRLQPVASESGETAVSAEG